MRLIPLSFIVKKSLKTLENVEFGVLHLTTPEGRQITARGKQPGPEITFIIHDWEVVRGLLEHGDIAFGEDYINHKWETSDVEGLITFFLLNVAHFEKFVYGGKISRFFFNFYNRYLKRNSIKGSSKNIQEHYDLGNDFYRLWLDNTMTYSSALYHNEHNTLEEAQKAKYQRILSRIGEKAKNILEIGCGWGGFAEEAAKSSKNVTGLTISPSQHEFALARLGDDAEVKLQDYRDNNGLYDAVVSIEMFEAVGERYWETYFAKVAQNLKKGGKAIIQTITMRDDCFEEYRKSSDFIRHYIFPGGMLPSMQKFKEEAAKAGLKPLESFAFGQDYARTLREWLGRFEARRSEILAMGYNEAFIRKWRFYLATCAAAFAVGRTNVVQVELVHI